MKKKQPLILFLVFLGLLLAALLNVLVGPLSDSLPRELTGQPWLIWLIFGVLVVVSALVAYWYARLQEKSPAISLDKQNRQHMLAAVRAIWITGVLEHSVHSEALLALGLREQPAAIANPWRLAVQDVGHAPRDLPPGTRITKAFDDAGGKLLILGVPGAGKTTLLLELARDLLARADQDEQHPIPVIFSLSSWASGKPALADWLVDEMKLKYSVPEKVGRAWVENDQLLPLLDGLDEVPESQRAACVEAINAYQQREGHGLTSLALSSRETEYLAAHAPVLLHAAVTVQPLTPAQIDEYLSSASGQLEGVRAALHTDPDLQALATTPLMLSVLSLAYQGKSAEDLLATPPAERQRHLFATYVQRMLERHKVVTQYATEQTKHWLGWLAQQMTQHNQTEFYLERLQPDWLPNARARRQYLGLAGLTIGLGYTAGLGAIFGWSFGSGFPVAYMAGFMLILGMGFGYYIGADARIKPTEILVWKWSNVWQGFTRFELAIASGVLLFLFPFGWLSGGPDVGVIGVLAGGVGAMLLRGWASSMLDTTEIFTPNQGIWHSARNGIRPVLFGTLLGILLGTLFGVLFGTLLSALFGVLLGSLAFAVSLGLGNGLIIGLNNGGTACIQHAFLRLLLRRTGCVPKGYVAFLDYAADCILLRKVGGGYSFIHRLLLEYFASLEATPTRV